MKKLHIWNLLNPNAPVAPGATVTPEVTDTHVAPAVDPQNGDFITINQDTYLQGSIAMRYAMRFLSDGSRPADRRRCIPSRIF